MPLALRRTSALTEMSACAPAAIRAMVQTISLPPTTHAPCADAAMTFSNALGMTSVTTTLVASDGPVLETTIW